MISFFSSHLVRVLCDYGLQWSNTGDARSIQREKIRLDLLTVDSVCSRIPREKKLHFRFRFLKTSTESFWTF